MRVFVIGGTGFIGSALVALLGERGHSVTLFRRGEEDRLENLLADCRPEVLFHLAWEGLPDYSWPMCRKNLEMGTQWYRHFLGCGASKIITAGTCWECGDLNMNTFAAAKTALRKIGETLAEGSGVSFLWARPFFVYGPGQRESSLIPSMIRRLKNGKKPEIKTPQAVHDFIHVKDVAKALALLAEKGAGSKTVDIGTGTLHTVGSVAQCVIQVLNSERDIVLNPKEPKDPGDNVADISALEKLGWQPEFDLIAGIRNTLQ